MLSGNHTHALGLFLEAQELVPDDAQLLANLALLERIGYRAPERGGEEARSEPGS